MTHRGVPWRAGALPLSLCASLITTLLGTSVWLSAGRSFATAASSSSATTAKVRATLGRRSLAFEVNRGQTNSRVRFLAHADGYTLFLTAAEAVLALPATGEGHAPQALSRMHGALRRARAAVVSHSMKENVVRLSLIGANAHAQAAGVDKLPSTVNYLIGRNKGQWHTAIPTYAKVAYKGVYPGVDLVYYGTGNHLEYDFVLARGTDPRAIRLRVDGAAPLRLDTAGNLVLRLPGGDVRWNKPALYQQTPSGVRKAVPGGYVLHGPHEVAFRVGAYDAAKPLVIDPTLNYTLLGGSDADQGTAIAVDTAGNVLITGFTASMNFPTATATASTTAALQAAFNDGGDYDAFVTKFSPNGALLFSTYLGGSDSDQGTGISFDSQNNIYVAGFTRSPDFPTAGASRGYSGTVDAFAAKLTPSGATLLYSTYLGGSQDDYANAIDVDSSGNAYVAGYTASSDFPTTAAPQTNNAGAYDAFVTKLISPTGAIAYSTYLGGSGYDEASSIIADGNGNAYVTGETTSANLITATSVASPALQGSYGGGGSDAFVTELNTLTTGPRVVYSTYLGGSGTDYGNGIDLDTQGNVYVTGFTQAGLPGATALQATSGGGDAFVVKLNPAGTGLLYNKMLGGSGFDEGSSIYVDGNNNAFVTGSTASSDFPTVSTTTNGLQSSYGGGASDAFISQLDATGNSLVYSTYVGGNGADYGYGIWVDSAGKIYVTGATASNNLAPGTAQNSGVSDAFLVTSGGATSAATPTATTGVVNTSVPVTLPAATATNTAAPVATSTSLSISLPSATSLSTPGAQATATATVTATRAPTQTPIPGGSVAPNTTTAGTPVATTSATTGTAQTTATSPSATQLVKFALAINPRTGRTAQGTISGGRTAACPSVASLLAAIGQNAAAIATAQAASKMPPINSRFDPPVYSRGCLWTPVQVTDPSLAAHFAGATVVVTATFPDGTSTVARATMDARGHAVAVVRISYITPRGVAHSSPKTIVRLSGVVTATDGVAQPPITDHVVVLR